MVANVLQHPTLVLNRSWQPINIATVARALTLVWNDHARIVEPETYQLFEWEDWARLEPANGEAFVQSVSQRFCVPEIVTLTGFDRMPDSHVTFSRRNIFKRDRFTCQYCGGQPQRDELTIDHVLPRAQGGQSAWDNCVLACLACNQRKADRTPLQANMRLRKEPKRPTWSPLYSRHRVRVKSWSKFVSEAYWTAELAGV